MTRRDSALLIFSLALTLLSTLYRNLHWPMDLKLSEITEPADAEGRLALGLPMKLSAADVYDLELIPGIADTLAFRIFNNKAEIFDTAATLPPSQCYRALEKVHGIGPKTALKLAESILILDDADRS